ncbi:glutathione binding-like protein [Aeromonas caviae]|uniref:glutathione binding-like protein n=1 Tax=Aeromonas caviae TaxID=648 RepID=UPI003EC537DD
MKVYELRRAPNARRVRMFLAEKGIEMEYQQVDLGAGENLAPATIEMWSRFIEFNLWLPTGMAFRHITGFYKDRERVFPEWGEECKQQAQIWFDKLDARLAEVPYIAGERFTIADILALCTIDFGKVVGLRITPEQPRLQDWHDRVSARSSAQA